MGDGGAYLTGFLLGELALWLVLHHPQISAWYPVLLFSYPIFEACFSIYRRKCLQGAPPGLPDNLHLHTLIHKRLIRIVGPLLQDTAVLTRRNTLTAPYLWLLSSLTIVPATLCWSNKPALLVAAMLFIGLYLWLYGRIIRCRTPRWLMMRL